MVRPACERQTRRGRVCRSRSPQGGPTLPMSRPRTRQDRSQDHEKRLGRRIPHCFLGLVLFNSWDWTSHTGRVPMADVDQTRAEPLTETTRHVVRGATRISPSPSSYTTRGEKDGGMRNIVMFPIPTCKDPVGTPTTSNLTLLTVLPFFYRANPAFCHDAWIIKGHVIKEGDDEGPPPNLSEVAFGVKAKKISARSGTKSMLSPRARRCLVSTRPSPSFAFWVSWSTQQRMKNGRVWKICIKCIKWTTGMNSKSRP